MSYIEREKAKQRLVYDYAYAAANILDEIPAADVVSRALFEQILFERDLAFATLEEHGIGLGQIAKHGEWIVTEDDYAICATEFTCSHCKVSLVSSELTDGQFLDMMKYCPNCGADMRGETK